MGMKGSWTDWHVDFAASSVYYTIHTGSKVFYFIRPTEKNLKAYNECESAVPCPPSDTADKQGLVRTRCSRALGLGTCATKSGVWF